VCREEALELGEHIRRYGHLMLPFVLIGLGLYILAGARVLLFQGS
jgi:cadmium resistance protein CadD (predicted permease)